jgi:hypothetical protein
MAQYTPVLAAEYNSIQLDVTKVLGDRFADTSARAWGYGAATSSTSVVVGQRITASEWGLLAQDVRSAYFFQTATDYGVPANVVQGNKVFWANVVSYQNAASTIVSNAGNPASIPFGNLAIQAYTDRTLPVWTTYGTYYLSRKYVFTDASHMRYFFNSGGYVVCNFSHGAAAPVSGNKDYAYILMLIVAAQNFDRAKWIQVGGLSGITGGQYIVTVTTGDSEPTDAYTDTSPHKISVTVVYTLNTSSAELLMDITINDEATVTTDGVTAAPFIGVGTVANCLAVHANGVQPIDGSSVVIPGTVPVTVAVPTITGNGPSLTDDWY